MAKRAERRTVQGMIPETIPQPDASRGSSADLRIEYTSVLSPDSREALGLEAAVFEASFGNSRDQLTELYARWAPASFFITVWHENTAVATGRIIAPSPLGSQAVSEMVRYWGASETALRDQYGIATDNVWDWATLSAHPDWRDGLSTTALVREVHMLGMFGSPWRVALLDRRVYTYIQKKYARPYQLLGLPPLPYEGSSATIPVYSNFLEWNLSLGKRAPSMVDNLYAAPAGEVCVPSKAAVARFVRQVIDTASGGDRLGR